MATLRNERKLASFKKEDHEEHPKKSKARDTTVPGKQVDYVTQVCEEIEGRVTKKLSPEFKRTEN